MTDVGQSAEGRGDELELAWKGWLEQAGARVERSPKWSREDMQGIDLKVICGRMIPCQVKSSLPLALKWAAGKLGALPAMLVGPPPSGKGTPEAAARILKACQAGQWYISQEVAA